MYRASFIEASTVRSEYGSAFDFSGVIMRNIQLYKKRETTVFIADDHPLIRLGLRLSLEQVDGIKVIGEAIDGYSAVEKILVFLPDVALLDVEMPGLSGTAAIRALRKLLPKLRIIVLSTYHNDHYIRETMDAGADGYVLKNIKIDDLARTIQSYHKLPQTIDISKNAGKSTLQRFT
ncbi:MAG: response regulator transcription factor [Geobacteraceae bacterium]|nr:response regulator transcription factor [Geobacteraceae bacterium]